ncbi:hypothetical protein FD14_GL000117 [Secundilactobacillus similis DSM 23365 = JCM 2765]|uniref:Uncharacterized protein n=1 Tax=Secundilactobacillus similis DSM 23365 = JCM 2765 TaxID=1423804 RepID=A0A0R2FBA7_9LACO|nr:hypothetical protein FD14_GL000117 [Secundilactobacillus similis DSM 23365 = JCM 2765]
MVELLNESLIKSEFEALVDAMSDKLAEVDALTESTFEIFALKEALVERLALSDPLVEALVELLAESFVDNELEFFVLSEADLDAFVLFSLLSEIDPLV